MLNSVIKKPGLGILAQGLKPHGCPRACLGCLWRGVIVCSCRDSAFFPLRHGTNAAQSQEGACNEGTTGESGADPAPDLARGFSPAVFLRVFAYLQRRGGGRGKMASEGRKINQLLFFIFDKVIKTRSATEGAGFWAALPPRGGTARRGCGGSFGEQKCWLPSARSSQGCCIPFGKKTGIPLARGASRRG